MNCYEPHIPRVALGIAAVAITVITIAVSVILPAQMNSGSREPRLLASKATAPASMGIATIPSIEVVAKREPASSTGPARIGEAKSQPGRPGKTTSLAVVRVSSTDP